MIYSNSKLPTTTDYFFLAPPPRFLVRPYTNSSTSLCNLTNSKLKSESCNCSSLGFSSETTDGSGESGLSRDEREGRSVLRLGVGLEGVSLKVLRVRGGGGGGGGCVERRFPDAVLGGEVFCVSGSVSPAARGVASEDVTEVSESFRLDRGGGGFIDDNKASEDWTWGGNSRRTEPDRSSREGREVDAEDRVLRGAGGVGGKFRFTAGTFSSGFSRSSEFIGGFWLLPLAPRFLEGGGAGLCGEVCGIWSGGKLFVSR